MIIVIGLVILAAAVIAGVAGVLGNGGSGHALTRPFAVFGYHVTGSTGRRVRVPPRRAKSSRLAGPDGTAE
jgi:hypothetical protein